MFRKFKFEEDFYDQLRCIPFCVRQKLDQSGVKLSLKSWNLFSGEERQKLCELDADLSEKAEAYRGYLVSLLEKLGQPVKFLEVFQSQLEKALWGNPARVPDDVETKLSQLGLCLSSEDWGKLDDLQRFVLLKLSQGKHDHVNLGPALTEFLNPKT
jgi:hypothetical protein